MKTGVYFTILAVLSQHYVQKSCAVHENGYVVPDAWNANNYNYVNYNGYSQHQEQQQQLANGFQTQQQMSSQYQYQTVPPFVGSGETWYANYGPISPQVESNFASPPNPYPNQYLNEQHQMQDSGLHFDTNQYPQYPGIQQQYQSSQVDLNGYAFDRSQYQYQDGTEQLQDQYVTGYNAPLQSPYGNELQGLAGGHGQIGQEINRKEWNVKSDANVPDTDASQLQHQQRQQHVVDYYPLTPQYPTENSQYGTRTTPINKPNGVPRRRIHEPTINAPNVVPDINIPSDKSQCPPGYLGLMANPTDCSKFRKGAATDASSNRGKSSGNLKTFCHQNEPGTYPHPYECSKFIKCSNGRIDELECRSGMDFNGTLLTCDHKYKVHCNVQWVGCSKQPTGNLCPDGVNGQFPMPPGTVALLNKQHYKIKCPPEIRGIFPFPFGNTQYIKCIDGRLLIKPCRRGFMFSLSRKLCDIKDYLLSYDTAVPVHLPKVQSSMGGGEVEYQTIRTETKSKNATFLECPPRVSGNFVYPFLNTRYVKCLNGVTEIETCLNGAIYSIRGKKCLPRRKIDTNDRVEGIGSYMKTNLNNQNLGVICGPQSVGRYAHPEDWRKFVICRYGVITVKKCPGDKIFDITLKECIETT